MLQLKGGYQPQNWLHKNPDSKICKINQQNIYTRQTDFKYKTTIEEGTTPDFSNIRASSGGQSFAEACDYLW